MDLEEEVNAAADKFGLRRKPNPESLCLEGQIPVIIGSQSYGLTVTLFFPLDFPKTRPIVKAAVPPGATVDHLNVLNAHQQFRESAYGAITDSSTPTSIIECLIESLRAAPPFSQEVAERKLPKLTPRVLPDHGSQGPVHLTLEQCKEGIRRRANECIRQAKEELDSFTKLGEEISDLEERIGRGKKAIQELQVKIRAETENREKRAKVISQIDKREEQIEFVAAAHVSNEVVDLLSSLFIAKKIGLQDYVSLLREHGKAHFRGYILPCLQGTFEFSPEGKK
jgi:hypothetical protein